MAKMPAEVLDENILDTILHLDDEEITLLATGCEVNEEIHAHLEACNACAMRVENATILMRIEPISSGADPRRAQSLIDRLTVAGVVAPSATRDAFIHVALGGDVLTVLNTNTEVRIDRQIATRQSPHSEEAEPAGVAFFRELGEVEVEVHLLRLSDGKFHLVVGVAGPQPQVGYRVGLHRGLRELACEGALHNTATFKSLRPDKYRVEILDGTRCLGIIEVGVERR